MHRPWFLTGMMGAGKSTVGRRLAEATGATFVDLDRRIERIFGESIEALFSVGEHHFRERERVALQSLIHEPGFAFRKVVVATGGGVVVDPENRSAMGQSGLVIFLDVPVVDLVSRLHEEAVPRPLLAQSGPALEANLRELLEARLAAYLQCDVRVDGQGTPEEVAGRVSRAVDRGPVRGASG